MKRILNKIIPKKNNNPIPQSILDDTWSISRLKSNLNQNNESIKEISSNSITVHMLWVEGNLGNLELLCCNSFIKNNFNLIMWTYGNMSNLPDGALQRDAREIIPEDRIFTYKNGSYAGFADLFRYAVLSKHGGLWADTDVICLMNMEDLRTLTYEGFFVSERIQNSNGLKVNNNVIYHPTPKSGDIIDLAYRFSDGFDVKKLEWGYCGPRLLTALVENWPTISPKIMEPNFANGVDFWRCPDYLIQDKKELPEDCAFLHCYNEMWRRSGVDKNAPYPKDSLIGALAKRYS